MHIGSVSRRFRRVYVCMYVCMYVCAMLRFVRTILYYIFTVS